MGDTGGPGQARVWERPPDTPGAPGGRGPTVPTEGPVQTGRVRPGPGAAHSPSRAGGACVWDPSVQSLAERPGHRRGHRPPGPRQWGGDVGYGSQRSLSGHVSGVCRPGGQDGTVSTPRGQEKQRLEPGLKPGGASSGDEGRGRGSLWAGTVCAKGADTAWGPAGPAGRRPPAWVGAGAVLRGAELGHPARVGGEADQVPGSPAMVLSGSPELLQLPWSPPRPQTRTHTQPARLAGHPPPASPGAGRFWQSPPGCCWEGCREGFPPPCHSLVTVVTKGHCWRPQPPAGLYGCRGLSQAPRSAHWVPGWLPVGSRRGLALCKRRRQRPGPGGTAPGSGRIPAL